MDAGAAAMTTPDRRRAGIRRTVLLLVAVALAVYLAVLTGVIGR